jgi:glycerol uptake facilitator-like aquaporin
MVPVVKKHYGAVAAELLGTGIVTMSFLIMAGYAAFPLYIGLTAAFALMVTYVIFGGVSGAHANPAVTFGMWTVRKVPTVRAVAYIAAQFLGALGAWKLFEYISGHSIQAATADYSTRVLVAEAVGAAVLMMGLCSALAKKYDDFQTAAAYGLAFYIAILITALSLTSSQGFVGYVNPAVALGMRHWGTAYIVGPLVGALVGAQLYAWVFSPEVGAAKTKKK